MRLRTFEHTDFDWDMRAVARRERVGLIVCAIGIVAGLALIALGATLAGTLLAAALSIALVARFLLGMTSPPEPDRPR